MNEPVYLNLSILELSKMVMHDFWYDCVKAIYKKKCKFMLHGQSQLYKIYKTEDIYAGIVKNGEARFDTSNYELYRPLPKMKEHKNNWLNER